MNGFKRLAVRLFGKRFRKKRFDSLEKTLIRARNTTPAVMYIATAILSSIIAAVVGFFVGYIFLGILLGLPLAQMLFLTLVFAFTLAFATYGIILVYPSVVAGNLKSKIDPAMSHASAYLYALTSGGTSLINAFKSLSEQTEEYGGIAEEAGRMVREIEYFGRDIPTAITNTAAASPSDRFRNFLETLLSVVQTGGNIPHYFADKTKEYRAESVYEQKKFLETLGLLAESYVVALGLGPLLIIVILVMLGTVGTFYTSAIYIATYVFIPFGSIGFILLFRLFTKGVAVGTRQFRFKTVGFPSHVPTAKGDSGEAHKEAIRSKKRRKRFTAQSLRRMIETPALVLFITIPAGIAYLCLHGLFLSLTEGSIVPAIIIMITPFAILYELRIRKIEKMEAEVPDFLRGLSSAVRSGLPLPRAIQALSTVRLGTLTSEVKKMQREIEWGNPTSEAFDKFVVSTKSPAISRAIALVKITSEAGGDIGEVTNIAAEDTLSTHFLKKEREGAMASYSIIVYLSFAVFTFTVLSLNTFLSGGIGAGAQTSLIQAELDPGFIKQIFLHAILLQAVFSGLIAGAMSTGRVLLGLKHSVIMLIIGYLAFSFFAA